MYKSLIILFTLTAGIVSAQTQSYFYQTLTFDKNPVVYKPSEEEKTQDIVTVSDKYIYEVAYDTDGQPTVYETSYTLYHVNSVKGVDKVNKVYISLRGVNEEIDVKARCITSENKVIYFNKATMKSLDNFENAGAFKVFAIDGVDVGCDVEVMYTNKKQYQTSLFSLVASSSKIVHFEAHILSPKNLGYETKTYNGLSAFKKDTSDQNKNHFALIHKNVPKRVDERYSLDRSNVMSFAAQLAYNYNKGNAKIYSWEIISKELYNTYYMVEPGVQKAITKLIDKNKIAKKETNEEKLKALESFIKTTFEVSANFEKDELSKSIDSKKISEANVVRLYISAFKAMEIPFEFVLTRNRNELKFDPKFPSYLFAREYVFYFPESDKFMSPIDISSRFGFPDPNVAGNEGLFVKEVNLGSISASSSKTKKIKFTDYTLSYHNYNVNALLDFTAGTVNLDVTQKLFGYSAYYVQPIYRYLSPEQKDDIKKSYNLSENMENIKDHEILNTEETDLFTNPMIVKFKAEQNDYLENAGNKYIFKVGLLIGKQAELYQETNRVTPADMGFTHSLKRELIINIPDGYKPTNLDDIIIKKTCMIDGKEAAIFSSSYEVKENKIIVSVYEDYKQLEYSVANFNDFVAVLNAAADFNKKSIIFDKK